MARKICIFNFLRNFLWEPSFVRVLEWLQRPFKKYVALFWHFSVTPFVWHILFCPFKTFMYWIVIKNEASRIIQSSLFISNSNLIIVLKGKKKHHVTLCWPLLLLLRVSRIVCLITIDHDIKSEKSLFLSPSYLYVSYKMVCFIECNTRARL